MIVQSVCSNCKLLVVNFAEEDHNKIHTCEAFPDGVPGKISFEGFDHRKYHLDGDNGILHQKGEPTIIKNRQDFVKELEAQSANA